MFHFYIAPRPLYKVRKKRYITQIIKKEKYLYIIMI